MLNESAAAPRWVDIGLGRPEVASKLLAVQYTEPAKQCCTLGGDGGVCCSEKPVDWLWPTQVADAPL